MTEIASNGRLRAVRHRVAHTPWPRRSLIRFVGLEALTRVAPLQGLGEPKYAAVVQSEHLDRKVAEAEAHRAQSAAAGHIPAPAQPLQ